MSVPGGAARWALAGVLAALAFGAWLRASLDPAAWWLNPDEGIYHQVATTARAEVADAVVRSNVHPALFYGLLRAAARGCDDPLALRALPLAAGLALILAAGWLGALAGGRAGGPGGAVGGAWLGAWATALSPALALQSLVLRPYTLAALAGAVALAALLRLLDTGRVRWALLASAAFTLSVLLLYADALLLAGVGLVLLGALCARRLDRRQVALLLLVGLPPAAALVVAYLTHLRPHVLGGALQGEAVEGWLRSSFARDPLRGLGLLSSATGYAWSRTLRPTVLLLGGLAALVALRRRRGFEGFLALAVAALAVAFSWARLLPLGGSRHALWLVPAQLAGLAAGAGLLLAWARAPRPVGWPARVPTRWALPGVVALLALPLAQRALRLALDPAQLVRTGPAPELLVTRADADAVAGFVAGHPEVPWLTDVQTAFLLMPYAPRDERVLVPVPDGSADTLAALGVSLRVLRAWSFPAAPAPGADPVERALGGLSTDGAAAGRVGLVLGGWGRNAALALSRAGAEGPAAGAEPLAAVLVTPAALRAWRQAQAATPASAR